MNLTCCNKPVKKGKRTKNNTIVYAFWCESCGRKGQGGSEEAALDAFKKANPERKESDNKSSSKQKAPEVKGLPARPEQLPAYVTQHMDELLAVSASFVERPALQQMVKRNVRYVMNRKDPKFLSLWGSPEGQESIIRSMEEAFSLGAELGKMGDLVVYGTVCEFIPAVECYEFALTQGISAPFAWINIEPIYKNDQVEIARKNGSFSIEFKKITPNRGELISLAVYGGYVVGNNQQVIGELYEVERLLEKAKQHSPSYRSFIRNMRLFEIAKSEGQTGVDSEGREYADIKVNPEDDPYFEQNKQRFEEAEAAGQLKGKGPNQYAEVEITTKKASFTKRIYRKDLEGVTKRIYLDDIVNPYDGPDRPEMLRKAAGKSFLGKYVKVRNSVAAMQDLRKQPETVEDALDDALDRAFQQFEDDDKDDDTDDIDAEYTVMNDDMETPGPGSEPEENKRSTQPPAGAEQETAKNKMKKEGNEKREKALF